MYAKMRARDVWMRNMRSVQTAVVSASPELLSPRDHASQVIHSFIHSFIKETKRFREILKFKTCNVLFSMTAFGIVKDAKLLHAYNEDSGQTARMRSLIRVFVGRTCQNVCFLTFWLICFHEEIRKM